MVDRRNCKWSGWSCVFWMLLLREWDVIDGISNDVRVVEVDIFVVILMFVVLVIIFI